MTHSLLVRRLLVGLILALLLAACGGGEAPVEQPSPSLAVWAQVDDISGSALKRNAAWAVNTFKLTLAEAAEHDGLLG